MATVGGVAVVSIARFGKLLFAVFIVALTLVVSALTAWADPVSVTNLITDDQSVNSALLTDPHLINAWGVSFPPGGPLWVSAADSSLALIYQIDPVTNAPSKIPFEVSVPGNPTGQVNNSGSTDFNSNAFLFASEDGTISGWRGALGTTAETLVPGSPDNSYKGLASAQINGNTYLYAADFHGGEIDVIKGNAGAPNLTGSFVDPNLPTGYAPFNVQNLDGRIYVTYALQNATKDEEVAGAGFGFVSVFDSQGNFLGRIGSQGPLNAPWGLALGPSTFGEYAGDLFVGNFGDGRINIFDLDGNAVGQLRDINGMPIAIEGLWALTPGNGGLFGNDGRLYFTAGPGDEEHGLVGVLSPVPEPATLVLLATGLGALIARRRPS